MTPEPHIQAVTSLKSFRASEDALKLDMGNKAVPRTQIVSERMQLESLGSQLKVDLKAGQLPEATMQDKSHIFYWAQQAQLREQEQARQATAAPASRPASRQDDRGR